MTDTAIKTRQLIPLIPSVVNAISTIARLLKDQGIDLTSKRWGTPSMTAIIEIAVQHWHDAIDAGEAFEKQTLYDWNMSYAAEGGTRAETPQGVAKQTVLKFKDATIERMRRISDALRNIPDTGFQGGDERPGYGRIMFMALVRYCMILEAEAAKTDGQ